MQQHLEAIAKSNHPLVVLSRRHIGFVKFLLVGSTNTLIDLTLYFFFSNIIGLNPIIANVLSTGITLCISFFLNHKFVFRSEKKKRSTAIQFVAVTLFNAWIVQSLIIAGVVHSLGNTPFFLSHIWTLNLLAKLCSVGVSFILNFLGYRYIFKMKESA
ncbi:MAG TPA: GtrA family protein [Candidatus Saccharimonadales bacterium]|nr:GtrA family protein [Candidatus Saccharimonadales bacterium]